MLCCFCKKEVKSKAGTMVGDYKKMTLHFNQAHKDKSLKERREMLIKLFPEESKGLVKKLERLERQGKKQKNDKKDTKKKKNDKPKTAAPTKNKDSKRPTEPKGKGVIKDIVKKTAVEHKSLKVSDIKVSTEPKEPKEPTKSKSPGKSKSLVWAMVIIGIAGVVVVGFVLLKKYKKESINAGEKRGEEKKEYDGRGWVPG